MMRWSYILIIFIAIILSIGVGVLYFTKTQNETKDFVFNVPEIPGAYISVQAVTQNGEKTNNGMLRMSMEYAPPWQENNYTGEWKLDSISKGVVYFEPGPNKYEPTVTMFVEDESGNTSDIIQFSRRQYRALVERTDAPYVIHHQFVMGRSQTTKISDVFAPELLTTNAKWAQASIELEKDESIDQIPLSEIKIISVNGQNLDEPIRVSSEATTPLQTSDNDNDGQGELVVKFPRENIENLLSQKNNSVTIQWKGSQGDFYQGTAWVQK